MNTHNKTEEVISNIKSITEGLTPEEIESVRDQLIAYLLFSSDLRITRLNDPHANRIQGLTRDERELIRKIAEQTERLHRLMNSEDEEGNPDQ